MIYLVCVISGSHDDIHTEYIFATNDKLKALRWVNHYNGLISQHYERIVGEYKNGNEVFMMDDVVYRNPRALIEEVKWIG